MINYIITEFIHAYKRFPRKSESTPNLKAIIAKMLSCIKPKINVKVQHHHRRLEQSLKQILVELQTP